jgi:hypothetical protein
LLDLVNKALDQMAFLIEMDVISALLETVFPRGNHRHRFLLENEVHEAVEIVAAVGNDVLAETASKQRLCLRDVMSVTTGQEDV